ncbi:MAG TPA: CARDB domain-containing protein, partial [Gemmataceae bacterium]|nr:CARDB domain-containing protein [Gemmataceae bacterium]
MLFSFDCRKWLGSTSQKPRRKKRFRLLSFELLEQRITPTTVTWINPAGGNWDTGANWSGGAVPGASDDVVIDVGGNVTITHSSNVTDSVNSITASDPVTLSGGTLTVAATFSDSSNVTLSGGTLANAIVAAGTILQGSGSLNDLSLSGTLNMLGGGKSTIINNLTLNNGLVELANSAGLNFSGTQTLSGTGNVEFTDNTGSYLEVTGATSVLTVAAGVTIEALPVSPATAAQGTIASESTGSSIVFNGTVSAAASGATIVINPGGATGTWTNNGAIESVSGGTLELEGSWANNGTITATSSTVYLGGTFTTAGLGTFTNNGSTVYLIGTLNNAGSTLALNSTTGPWLLGGNGVIIGGTITTAGSGNLDGQGVLNGVTLAGTINLFEAFPKISIVNGLTLSNGLVELANQAALTFSGGTQTLGGTGVVEFADSSGTFMNATESMLTVAAGITLEALPGSGSTAAVGTVTASSSTIAFDGTVSATGSDSTIELNVYNNSGAWTNNGAIEALNGGSVVLAGSFTNAGTIVGPAGFIYLDGTLDNSGQTLALTNSTGSWYMRFGTILGGTVSTSGGAALIATNDPSTLNGVTLAGTLDLTSSNFTHATVSITNGLTLDQGLVELSNSSVLNFSGTQTLGGTGTVTLTNEVVNPNVQYGFMVPSAGDMLTVAPGVTIQGNSGTVGSSGGGLITNQGTMEADGGGTLTVQGYTNFAGGTLTGGAWEAVGNSTLRLVGANITTNAATILLDGASSNIYSGSSGTTNALAGFVTNAATGSFTIQNAANFGSSGAFTNAGTLTINNGSTFSPGGAGVYTQTSGTTILDAGTLGTSGNQINIQGGTLSGPGTINGNLINAGEVDLGSSPGTLTVTGSYSQTSVGTLALEVGGATAGSLFDQINITGAAALGGTLNVSLINGYAPGLEETYDVLNFASSSGSFATFNSPQINGNPAFATTATPTSFDLLGATIAPNLAASNIAFTPANPLLNQNVTVTFTVTNLGTVATTAGSWTDSVYLSTEAVVDGNAVLLGRVMHTGDLASQAQYFATLTAPLPGLAVGSYHVIVVVDSGLQVPDVNRANGTGVAPTELSTQPPTLTVGTSISGTIANGQDLYYRLNVAPGTSVVLGATFAVAV